MKARYAGTSGRVHGAKKVSSPEINAGIKSEKISIKVLYHLKAADPQEHSSSGSFLCFSI
jgi:hypothetical protein